MQTISSSALIQASPEAIWEIVSRPERAAEWMPDVKGRELAGAGPAGPGSRWTENGLLRGKPYKIQYEVSEWTPPRRLCYRQVSAEGGQYDWEEAVLLEPEGGGATRVTLQLSYRLPRGFFGRIYDRFVFRKDFPITQENRLEGLKELVEGNVSSGS